MATSRIKFDPASFFPFRMRKQIMLGPQIRILFKGKVLGTSQGLLQKERVSGAEADALNCLGRLTAKGIDPRTVDNKDLFVAFEKMQREDLKERARGIMKERKLARRYLQESPFWKVIAKRLIELSSEEVRATGDYEAAKAEWVIHPEPERQLDEWYADKKRCCLCNNDIRWGFRLKNIKTGREIIVGSECVADHSMPRGEEENVKKFLELSSRIKELKGKIERLKAEKKDAEVMEQEKALELIFEEQKEMALWLAILQEVQTSTLKLDRIRRIRAYNERYLREKKIPQLQEMLDTLWKYRGIVWLINRKGPAIIAKVIRNLRHVMSAVRGLRENAIYLHDIDVRSVNLLYKILLDNVPVLNRYPDIERKMRALWNHRHTSVHGKKIFGSKHALGLISRMYDLWNREITERDIHGAKGIRGISEIFPISMEQAEKLTMLYSRFSTLGFITTEEVLARDPYMKSKLARMKAELSRFSPEDQVIITRVIQSFGTGTFNYSDINSFIRINDRVKSSTELSVTAVRALATLERRMKLEHEEVRRFVGQMGEKFERDGIFFTEDILRILRLAAEREETISKARLQKMIPQFASRLTTLYKWRRLFPKDEEIISTVYTEWNYSIRSRYVVLDISRMTELYSRLYEPRTLSQYAKQNPDFKRLVEIRRAVVNLHDRDAVMPFFSEISQRAINILRKNLVSELYRFNISTAGDILPLLEELQAKFMPKEKLEKEDPELAAKLRLILSEFRYRNDFARDLPLNGIRVLWEMGYFDLTTFGEAVRKLQLPPEKLVPQPTPTPKLIAPKVTKRAVITIEDRMRQLFLVKWNHEDRVSVRFNTAASWEAIIMGTNNREYAVKGLDELLKALGDWFYWEKRHTTIWSVHARAVRAFWFIMRQSRWCDLAFQKLIECEGDKSRYGALKILNDMSKMPGEMGVRAKKYLESNEDLLKELAGRASAIPFGNPEFKPNDRAYNVARWHKIVMETTDRELAITGIKQLILAEKYEVGTVSAKARISLTILAQTRWGDLVRLIRDN